MPPLEVENELSQSDSTDFVGDKIWLRSFPSSMHNKKNGVKFLRKAIYVAFSQILSRRKILAKDRFVKFKIADKVSISMLSLNHPETVRIAQMFRAVAIGVQDERLEELALVLTEPEHSEHAIEVFSFRMHYEPDRNVSAVLQTGGSMLREVARLEYQGSESVRSQLIVLVRSINVLCQKVLKALPERYSADFRVAYVPGTPAEYQIAGFVDHPSFYTPHPSSKTVHLGYLRPSEHAVSIECSSLFIEDVAHADAIRRCEMEKVTRMLGYETADYTTFRSDYTSSQITVIASDTTTDKTAENDSRSVENETVRMAREIGDSLKTPSPRTARLSASPSPYPKQKRPIRKRNNRQKTDDSH